MINFILLSLVCVYIHGVQYTHANVISQLQPTSDVQYVNAAVARGAYGLGDIPSGYS